MEIPSVNNYVLTIRFYEIIWKGALVLAAEG